MSGPPYAPLPPRHTFLRRLGKSAVIGATIVLASLVIGIFGYHYFEGQSWLDAFDNAAMILSGMGPLGDLHTRAGKLFAGFYALYSGLALILIVGIVFAPVVHRFLHRFHLELGRQKPDDR
jgi:hypothetical protein